MDTRSSPKIQVGEKLGKVMDLKEQTRNETTPNKTNKIQHAQKQSQQNPNPEEAASFDML